MQPTRVHFWRADQRIGNFGDALNIPILKALGLKVSPAWPQAVNADRSLNTPVLFALGSILDPINLGHYAEPITVWGSGWRGVEIPPVLLAKVSFCAVRGPDTRAALTRAGVAGADALPQGDPAFLLPWLFPEYRQLRQKHVLRRGADSACARKLLMPHFLADQVPAASEVGCNARLNSRVRQRHAGFFSIAPSVHQLISSILRADFLLTSAMHGAIVAQAFGVPWAMWGARGVDCPPKWEELGRFLGISIEGLDHASEGLEWWQSVGRFAKVPDLTRLVAALPADKATTKLVLLARMRHVQRQQEGATA